MILDLQSAPLFADASRRLGGSFAHARGHRILTWMAGDEPIAYAVYTGVSDFKCELTMWADPTARGLAGRQWLRAVFSVPFQQWGCGRVHSVIRESNRRSIAAALAVGFEFEALMGRWFGDEDGWMFRMYPDQCRWIK